MANSPRPSIFSLERSRDHGQTWQPWQYFADNPSDCFNFFGVKANERISSDDSVICTTQFSKVVPLENGEVRTIIFLFVNSSDIYYYAESQSIKELYFSQKIYYGLE